MTPITTDRAEPATAEPKNAGSRTIFEEMELVGDSAEYPDCDCDCDDGNIDNY